MAVSLKSQFRVLFGFVVAVLALFGWLSLHSAGAINDQTGVIADKWLPRVAQALGLVVDLKQYRTLEAQLIIANEPSEVASTDQLRLQQAKLFDDALAQYSSSLQSEGSQEEARRVTSMWQAYLNTAQVFVDLARANKDEEAHAAFKASKPAFDGVTGAIQALATRDQARAADARSTAHSVYSGIILTVVSFIVVMVLLAIAGALYFELSVSRLLLRLTHTMATLAKGDFGVDIHGQNRSDEIGAMARAVQVFKENGLEMRRLEAEAARQQAEAERERNMTEEERAAAARQLATVVQSIGGGLERLAQGDLVCRLEQAFAPAYEKLRTDFNAAVTALEDAMVKITGAVTAIRHGSGEISEASDDMSKRTEHQAASLEETAAAVEEITATVKTTADGAGHARRVVSSAKADAEQSGAVVRQAVEAMANIETSSKQIGQIIGVIDEIAFQTNLLALNAGVEAARAGEAGKGFAVVASEVRGLAQRSAEAAKEIKALISTSTAQVDQGVELVDKTGEALVRIVAQVGEINGIVTSIAASTQEQATGLQQVNTAVSEMDKITQQNAAMVEEATAASHSLAQEAAELAILVARFRLGSDTHSDARSPAPKQRSAPRPMASSPRAAVRSNAALKLQPEPGNDSWQDF